MTDYQDALVLENLDLVNWVIRTRISIPNRPLLTYDDFYAIGCEAICRAALKYQPDRVVKRPSFSTFILKSSLVYVEGGLHAEFEVWEYSDTAYAMENAHRVKHQTLWKGGQQWKYF